MICFLGDWVDDRTLVQAGCFLFQDLETGSSEHCSKMGGRSDSGMTCKAQVCPSEKYVLSDLREGE
jgi:hypothetical protein